jgi:hypothetical protein
MASKSAAVARRPSLRAYLETARVPHSAGVDELLRLSEQRALRKSAPANTNDRKETK